VLALGVVRGRVLIIEDDEWVGRLLAKFLGDAGYETHVASEARAGFEMACELLPDCILCDVELPDLDGFWVARRVRTEPSRLCTTPFLFLTSSDQPEARLQGFNVGADAYMTKPFRHEEVVAQVSALIAMASRLREQRDSFAGISPVTSSNAPALRGDLAQMSVATVLTVLEMEQRSGVLKVRNDANRQAELHTIEGALVATVLDGKGTDPIAALREALAWKAGRFWFRPSDVVATPAEPRRIGALLIEAMRLDDEARRG
jgi:two-component system, OmpR family, response regulator